MKKFLLTGLLAIAAGVFSFAQPKVGDVYEVDGIKTIVIHVSDDGKSGIVINSQLSDTRDIILRNTENKKIAKKQEKKIFKDRKKMYDLFSQFSDDASQNTAIIEKYCQDNGLSFEEYFPEYAYAKSLGDGWYIPGKKEAEYYSYFIGNGIGEDNYKSFNMKLKQDIIKKGTYYKVSYNIDVAVKFVLSCVEVNNKKFQHIYFINMTRPIDSKDWFDIRTNPMKGGILYQAYPVCPVKNITFNE